MKVKAQDVRAGDVVQGIGLVVEYSEPHSDFSWSLVGHYTYRDPETGEVQATGTETLKGMAYDHMVRVSRPFQAGDVVTVATESWDGSTVFIEATVTEIVEEGVRVRLHNDPAGSGTLLYPFSKVRHAPIVEVEA